MLKLFLGVIMVVFPSISYGSGFFVTGNKLMERLESSNVEESLYGVGYILGVHDSPNGVVFCSPKTTTVGQLSDIVLAGLKSAPTVRHNNADLLVSAIFKAVFPCEKKEVEKGGDVEL